tara:strand:- start:222 stop:551 length:330 start_codon:yes stop_codon:yes gene_type:complete
MIDFSVQLEKTEGTATSIDSVKIPANQGGTRVLQWVHIPVEADINIQIRLGDDVPEGLVAGFSWDQNGPFEPSIDMHFGPEEQTVAFWMDVGLAEGMTEGEVPLQGLLI